MTNQMINYITKTENNAWTKVAESIGIEDGRLCLK